MKNHFVFLSISLLVLSGCSKEVVLEHKPYDFSYEVKETFKEEKGDIHYREDKINNLHIDKVEGINIKTNVYDVKELNDVTTGYDSKSYSSPSNDLDNPNNYIESNLLVVPVYFTDSSVASDENLKENKKTLLENAFFGENSLTNYESVASYYHKSSYGHLKIKGEVLPWLNLNESSQDALAKGKNNPEEYSDSVVSKILDNIDEVTFKKYSSVREGTLDALYIIYDYPYSKEKSNDENSLFWAYVYHYKKNNKVSQYAWSSFDFVGEKALDTHRVDTTTYIHETGHLFGLNDYYNKGNYSIYQPMGFMDMMDYNLGDHTPFSKYLLNWASPYVLDMGEKETGTINIRPFSESGDFILVPSSSYNGTPYDRYLLISFFTPTGLNDLKNFPSYIFTDKDGVQKIFTYPNKYGILVYEVNAQLGYFSSSGIRQTVPTCYITETPKAGDYVISFYHSNELNKNDSLPLYHLLESSGQNTFKEGNGASNDTLFIYNSTFGINTFTDLADEFGITFKVSKINLSEASITFYKKA